MTLHDFRYVLDEIYNASLVGPNREAQELLGEVMNYLDDEGGVTKEQARENLRKVRELDVFSLQAYQLTLKRILDET